MRFTIDKKNERPSPKWGAGSLQAALRHGLDEVRSLFYGPGNVEQGMYGTTLPSEVQRQRDAEPDLSGPRVSSIIDRLQRLAGKEPAREDRELERE